MQFVRDLSLGIIAWSVMIAAIVAAAKVGSVLAPPDSDRWRAVVFVMGPVVMVGAAAAITSVALAFWRDLQ